MKKFTFILALFAISLQSFSTNWMSWGFEGFNTSGTPNNWSQEQMTGSSNWVTYGGLYTPHEGSGNIYFSTLISSVGDATMLVSESFNNSGVDNSLFTFWHQQKEFTSSGENNTLDVYYRTSATSAWVLLESYTDAFNNWTEELIMLPEQSSEMQLGFKATLVGGASDEGVALDIVKIMYLDNACSFPINFNVGETNPTTAQIMWEESGSATNWDIEYGNYGYTLGTGTAVNGINTTPEYTITGLTAGNQYDVYVRSDCGGSQSEWIGPLSFYAECNVISSFPYEENFDNSNFDEDDWNVGLTVNCWTEEDGIIDEPTVFSEAQSDWKPGEFGVPTDYNPDNANSAMGRLIFGSSWLISPTFNLGNTNNFQLEFDIALTDYNGSNPYTLTNQDTIAVVISTDGGTTWNKSNILHIWDATTNPSEISPSGIHQIINLETYTGNIKIAFYISGSGGHSYIDNVKIKNFSTTPELELLEPFIWNAGPQLINGTMNSGQIFTIRNSGIGTLTINSITDLSSTEFTTDFDVNTNLNEGEEYSFSFNYNPTDLMNDIVSFEITTDYGTETITLNGEAYELASCEIEIGTDNQEVNLPTNFNYNHSFSESIFLQSEINRVNEDFRKIYFFYNGNDQFQNIRDFTIYMKHTAETELSTWEDINTFTELGTISLDFTTEGWYEIDLETSFPYNNSDNIILAVYSEKTAGQTFSAQSMYAHNAPNNELMSITTYSSSQIDLDNLPAISPIAYRPNVRFCLENTTNIINSSSQKQTKIYPNPANNLLTIDNACLDIKNIQILDITGKIILNVISHNTIETINISELEKGIYFVKINSKMKTFIKE